MRSNQALRYSLIGVLAVSILFTASLLIGMSDITLTDVLGMLFNYDGSKQHQILYTIRIPRALLCMFVGASMAVSGLVMQGLTKNPLASPQVLGVNAGATLAIIVVIVFFPGVGYQSRIIAAFIGAGVIGSLVQVIGFTKRLTPIKLSLVGISVQLFLSAITKFIMIFNESKTEQLYFWTVGGVHHATLKHIAIITQIGRASCRERVCQYV